MKIYSTARQIVRLSGKANLDRVTVGEIDGKPSVVVCYEHFPVVSWEVAEKIADELRKIGSGR